MKRGRLIVIEGTDGSGKSTQFARLCRRLDETGKAYERLVFPQYDQPSSALIRMYLGGEFGEKPGDVNPYAASAFYAVDRYASMKKVWGDRYQAGGLVLADRYTTSNAVHQASKLPDGEREKFLDWLFGFEYGLLGLPEPSLVFYLDVPTEVTERLMRERERATHTAADIHEADDAYLRECRENARGVAARCGWQSVDCTRYGQMRGIEDIHEEVYARVKALLG